jgi:hypothetical protein
VLLECRTGKRAVDQLCRSIHGRGVLLVHEHDTAGRETGPRFDELAGIAHVLLELTAQPVAIEPDALATVVQDSGVTGRRIE